MNLQQSISTEVTERERHIVQRRRLTFPNPEPSKKRTNCIFEFEETHFLSHLREANYVMMMKKSKRMAWVDIDNDA